MRLLVLSLALALAGCPHHSTKPTPAPTDAGNPDAGTVARLRIVNKCEVDIWVQQQGFPTDALVHLDKNASHDYDIPAAGLASTRFWPKILCDKGGNNCAIGQSSAPCPSQGCAPPVDSKLEATWGCTLADKTKCGYTPQGVRMIDTFWNASTVDGYTLPFTVGLKGGDGRASCTAATCDGLATTKCPTDEDLSNGGKNPKYAHQNLAVKNPATTGPTAGGYAGCFATCSKLSYPGWGGDGVLDIAGAVDQMYCCPTPPISSPACQAGPVAKTKYVQAIHKACNGTAYGFAYDDAIGARTCSGDTILEFTVGPKCVEIAAK